MFELKKVTWERIHLYLDIDTDQEALSFENLHYYLVDRKGVVATELRVARQEGNHIQLTLNITNSGINRCIENGTYSILVAQQNQILAPVLFFGSNEDLASWNNHFLYDTNRGCYTITFMVDQFTNDPELRVLFYDTKIDQHPMPDKALKIGAVRRSSISIRRLATRLRKPLKRCRDFVRNNIYRLVRAFKRKPGILFLSEQDDKIPLNMAAIYDRMVERGLDKEYNIYFSLRRKTSQHYTILSNFTQVVKLGKSDVVIVDDHVPFFDWFRLNPKVRLIQIWHAGAGFKGVGYSRWGHYGCPGPVNCHRRYTYCISGSKAIAPFFSEQFGILDEQIIPTGMPRMDAYIDNENRARVTARLYEEYPVLKGRHVVLFAPTYRGQGRKTAYYPYDIIDFDDLYRYCLETDSVILFKMHPWVSDAVPIREEHKDRFIDMNRYPNINELFYVTDVLITDYSSSMYEFILMNKPMLLFPYDKNQYATSRGFHRDYDSNVPGKICMTFPELMTALRNQDYEYEKIAQAVATYFDQVDSNSRDRIIDWLVLGNLPEEYRKALQKKQEQVAAIRSLRVICPNKDSYDGAYLISK